jgi:large subunit ribosomal protein L25
MKTAAINAEKRDVLGRKVKKLRRAGKIPANVYGKKVKSDSIVIDLVEFNKLYKETGETSIVEVKIGKESKPTLIHNVQVDPVTDAPIHVDFLQVDLKQKVTTQIPVEFVGESPAEKQGLGTVVLYLNEVEVEALPGDLVESFQIDISEFSEVDQQLLVKDLKVDKSKIEIKTDPEQIVAKVEAQKEEVEEPAPVVEEGVEGAEVATAGEGEKEETTTETAEEDSQ